MRRNCTPLALPSGLPLSVTGVPALDGRTTVAVTPTGVKKAGELLFQFTNGHSIHGYVFTATGLKGKPKETYEATPMWISEKNIPYHKMWADDRIWLPLMLAGKKFTGRFLFDGDMMLGCEMELGAVNFLTPPYKRGIPAEA